MAVAKLSRANFDVEQVPVWQQLHHSASVTTSDGDVLVLDLLKLSLLSPFFKDVIDTFSIPSSLKHLLDVNIILPDFNSDVIGVLVEVLEGMVADVTDVQIKCIRDLLKVLGLKVGLLKDGEKINSVKSVKMKNAATDSEKLGSFSKSKDTLESRTVKFRSNENPKPQKVNLVKKNLKKKVVDKRGLKERASLNSIKKKVDAERRQRNEIILHSVKRLGFGAGRDVNNQNVAVSYKDDEWVSRDGRGDDFAQVNDEFARMPSNMMRNSMNNSEGFVSQQPYEQSMQVGDTNSVRQVMWDDGRQMGDHNMNDEIWGEQRRSLLQREVAIDPGRYETGQVYFSNQEMAYEGGMNYRGSQMMGMGRQEGIMSTDSGHERSFRVCDEGMMNTGMGYAGGDMGSERESRVDYRGGYIGMENEVRNSREGNLLHESNFEGRHEHGNEREAVELKHHSFRRDKASEVYKKKRKRKPRWPKSDLDGEASRSNRTRREDKDSRDRFREASSNSQLGDHFEQRTPHRDYSR